jgi:UDP-N-acetylmuramate--alanine ligase
LDDYGHHPTEIKATLEAVRLLNPQRLLVIFQPHRYTRTKLLLDSFASCFQLADYVIITDIYPAGESAIEGVSGYSIYERLIAEAQQTQEIVYLPKENIFDHVINILNPSLDKISTDYSEKENPQEIVLVLGAGDITKISDELAQVCKIKRQAKGKRTLSSTHQL